MRKVVKHNKGDWELTKLGLTKIGGNICYPYFCETRNFRIYADDIHFYTLKEVYFHCAPSLDDSVNEFIANEYADKIEKCEDEGYGKEDAFISSLSAAQYDNCRRQYLRACAEELFDVDTDKFVDDEDYRKSVFDNCNETIKQYNATLDAVTSPKAGLYQMF